MSGVKYWVECIACDAEIEVTIKGEDEFEPSFCPLCGADAQSGELDSDG